MQESISVFDILKIGVGPSSSHTFGPWKAALRFVSDLKLENVEKVQVHLYGSLALTGKGHGTDIALMLGLVGENYETIPIENIKSIPDEIVDKHILKLAGKKEISFFPDQDIVFIKNKKLPFHSNGMIFLATDNTGHELLKETYYSIGGGFVVNENEATASENPNFIKLPFPSDCAEDILRNCKEERKIHEMVFQNELSWKSQQEIESGLRGIWGAMKDAVYRGCHTEGNLPGGLEVVRRAPAMNKRLLKNFQYSDVDEWIATIKKAKFNFSDILEWISCFAMAVNEENASFGRVVTAPTNGSAGVIPAVLLYYICFSKQKVKEQDIFNFLMVAGEIGSLFKKGSTLSAAMGGCQAEIGVSSSMAAGALTECLGGTVQQSLTAAEIAMEHHLGLTCDPVGGLVQIPCIERNSMGAIKAITASKIALDSDPQNAKVSLDNVIKTMWQTAQDMNTKYKETSQGGLAANISVKVSEC